MNASSWFRAIVSFPHVRGGAVVAVAVAGLSVACDRPSKPLSCPPKCMTELDSVTNLNHLRPDSMKALREIGWALLVPLTAKNEGLPDSSAWTPSRDLFPFSQTSFHSLPLEVDLIDPQRLEPQEPLRYESTFFNPVASRHIRNQRLNEPATTQVLQAGYLREVVFPPESMALKTFWYPLKPGGEIKVRLWDWNRIKEHQGTDLDNTVTFDRRCVRMRAENGCLAAKDTFYTVVADDPALFCRADCKVHPDKGDLMLLIGVHIASKQTPEWLWATYWWRGNDDTTLHGDFWTCQDAQRPKAIEDLKRSPWLNYSMNVTASFKVALPLAAKDEKCGYPGPIQDYQEYQAMYNPLVEALFSSGLKSSCVNCHARATTNREVVKDLVPSELDKDSPHFHAAEGHIRLDYMWSLTRGLESTSWPPR